MARVHQVSNKRGELADLLGMSLGQGLAGMANDYYANKAINRVTEDKSLENAPIEKKFSKLEEALRPFGEKGQRILANKLAIEQEGQKARESAKKSKEKAEVAKHFGVPEGTPDSVLAAMTKEQEKGKRTQAALDFIKRRKANIPAAPGQEQILAPEEGRPLEGLSTAEVHEALAIPELADFAKAELDNRKFQSGEAKSDRDYNLKVNNLSEDYRKELNKQHANAGREKIAIAQIENAIKSKKLGPNSWANLFQTHLKGTFLEHAADSQESGTFQAALPQLLGGFESIFKRGLTDRDLKLILDKLPSIGKTDEANLASVDFLKKILDLNDKKYEISNEILKENKGLAPINFQNEVERRYEEKYGQEIDRLFADTTDSVIMMDPKTGRRFPVPRADVERATGKGAVIPND